MKVIRMILIAVVAFCSVSSAAAAGDFDWLRDLNVQAVADASGFRARLAARFQIGDAQISAVLGNVEKPADAYMVMRLGEMAKRPPEEVLERYKAGRGKGWGALAKSMGIKPGSRDFHALKRGHDLDSGGKGHKPGKDKPKGKGKNKD
jgi:hypothetical protein